MGVIGPGLQRRRRRGHPHLRAGRHRRHLRLGDADATLTTSPAGGKFFFRTVYRNDLEGLLAGLFASFELQAEKGWLIDDGEPYGQDLADAADQVATGERGADRAGERAPRHSGLQPVTARIAQDNPDFVGFAGFTREAALLYRQLRDAGYTGIFGSVDAAASVPGFVQPVGPEAEGVLFAGCSLTLPQDFVADFSQLHGHEPEASAFVAQYADAATILLDAVAKVAAGAARRLADHRPERPARRRARHQSGGRALRLLRLR